MFTIEIRFLTGRYAAGAFNDPSATEWPPHPARLYSALTAALYDDEEPSVEARAALQWLAQAGAPTVIAPCAGERRLGEVFVPTNDPKVLTSIDKHILNTMAATAALEAAEGKARSRAERKLERAADKARERSLATAANDGTGITKAGLKSAVELLERRPRHARNFPVSLPEGEVAHMRWDVDAPDEISATLDELCERVARLGHSSSLVALRVVAKELETGDNKRWVPDPSGDTFLRVPFPDQLRLLDEAHARHQQAEPRVLPSDDGNSWYRLAEKTSTEPASVLSDFASNSEEWIVYEVVPEGRGERRTLLDVSLAQQLARALRGTLLKTLRPDAPASLSGHDGEGRPTTVPHLAFVPLADVGHSHATGSILGVALVPPRALPVQDRDALLEAIFQAEREGGPNASGLRLTLGRAGVVHLSRRIETSSRRTLRPARWTGSSRRWASVTAVALGRNPGNLQSRDPDVVARAIRAAETTVATACVNIGLPEPSAVWIHRRSLIDGAPAANRFMPFPDTGAGPRRVCVHVEVLFDEPMRGPVMLGAGRFFGVGLCVPVRDPGPSARHQ